MAKYQQLPIYRLALELVVFLEDTVRGFSRYHKYSIGERLRQSSWDVVTLVVKANNTPVARRVELLTLLRDKTEEISIALAVAKELPPYPNGDRRGMPIPGTRAWSSSPVADNDNNAWKVNFNNNNVNNVTDYS